MNDRRENSILEARWLLAVPLSVMITVMAAGVFLI